MVSRRKEPEDNGGGIRDPKNVNCPAPDPTVRVVEAYTDMQYEHIIYQKNNSIAVITLNRPDVLNARNVKMRKELISACQEIEEDTEVRVVIITGAGHKAFSVGLDLKERSESRVSPVEARRLRGQDADAEAVARLSKPTIAAINGYALGGGCEICLACDIRIAAEDAKIGLVEAGRGLIPGSGGTQRLPRLIGKAKALELMLTAATIDGKEAYRIGLANKVVPQEDLLAEAEKIAAKIASLAPIAVRYIKEAVNKGLEMPLEEGLRLERDLSTLIRTTEDAQEGSRAFVEKRAPQYTGV